MLYRHVCLVSYLMAFSRNAIILASTTLSYLTSISPQSGLLR
jgi:hypothetical protein